MTISMDIVSLDAFAPPRGPDRKAVAQPTSGFSRLLEERDAAEDGLVPVPAPVIPFETLLADVAGEVVAHLEMGVVQLPDDPHRFESVRDATLPTAPSEAAEAPMVDLDVMPQDPVQDDAWRMDAALDPPVAPPLVTSPREPGPRRQSASNDDPLLADFEPIRAQQSQTSGEPMRARPVLGAVEVEFTDHAPVHLAFRTEGPEAVQAAPDVPFDIDLAAPDPTPELPARSGVPDVVRVQIDERLAVEVAARDGEVDVTLLGSDAVHRVLASAEPELRRSLHEGGFELGRFQRREDASDDAPRRHQPSQNHEDDDAAADMPRRVFVL